jgi:LysM repeat protein
MKRLLLLIIAALLVLTLVPLPSTQAAPNNGSGCTCKAYYKVKRGDYLSYIAARYGVSTKAIQNCNNIKNRNKIYPGQVLCIPGKAAPPPSSQPPSYYPPPPQPGDGPATACAITPILGFGSVWFNNQTVREKIGCPTAPEKGFNAVEQGFYSGYVVNNLDEKKMYIIFTGVGQWTTYPDTWVEGDPVTNPTLTPPPGWYQPEYGIGKMWRNEDNYSQRLGWARYPQRPVTATWQPFERGEMIWTATQGVIVLYDSSTYRQFK